MDERIVTLVDEGNARVGYVFQYREAKTCAQCRYRGPCVGRLRDGRIYRVVGVRGACDALECPLIEEKPFAVEVIPERIRSSIPKGMAVQGLRITYKRPECSRPCEYSYLCRPPGLLEGDKVVIDGVEGDIPCPLGLPLLEALLLPLLD
jgi:uncharacterized protein (UPF0179 family)